MNSFSPFEGRERRPRESRTNNFHQWSQGGKAAHSAAHQQGANTGYISTSPSHQQFQAQQEQRPYLPHQPYLPQQQPPQSLQYNQQQQPSLQGYQQPPSQYQYQYRDYQQPYYQQPSSHFQQPPLSQITHSTAETYGFRQRTQHNFPDHQKNAGENVNELKSKIIQARVRNLALKRAIVQRSLAGNVNQNVENTIVRTQSASSSRHELSTSSSDVAGSELPPPDAISELEEKLKKLKSEAAGNKPGSTQLRKEDNNEDRVNEKADEKPQRHPSKHKTEDGGRRSRRTSKAKEESQLSGHPDVPLLPLGNKKSASTHDADSEEEMEEQHREVVRERPKKKKNRKKNKIDVEKLVKEDEALAKSIDKIMDNVSNEIETNEGILEKEKKKVSSRVEGGLHAPLDSYRMKELRRNEERKKRAEARDKIDSLLNNENLEFKIPRWKHELNGNMNPKPELVLKGKSLFRMAAYLVLFFYAKPIVRVRVMRIMGRDNLKEELTKAILLSLDTCASWLTSVSKVPLSSIVQDQSLNFSGLQQKDQMSKKGFHQQCNLQLKVRVTAMVKGITKIDVDDVPTHVRSFLVRFITDGNFFRSDFLYGFEKKSLEFDKLGATNNVTKQLTDDDLLKRAKDQLAAREEGELHVPSKVEEVVVGDITYLMSKAKMLIRNFLFLRVFITNILLSPWDHGIGPKPLPKQKKIIDNLRMTASIFYVMLRMHQHEMPRISHGNRRKTIQRMKSGKFGNQGIFQLGPDVAHDQSHSSAESGNNSVKRQQSNVINRQQSIESVAGDEEEDLTNDQSEKNEKKDQKKLPAWLTTFADKVLGEAQALNITETDDATSFLLRNRPPFDNDIEHLHVFLFGDHQLEHTKHLLDPWVTDLAQKLETWVDSLTRLLIKDMKVKYQAEHDI